MIDVAALDFDQPDSEHPDSVAPGDAGVLWQETYTAAMAEAAKGDMPVLIRFTASWCGPCQVMDANVWPNERVNAALENRFIPVKIDIDQDAETARNYGVRSIPTLLLVDSDGDELARGGFMSVETLVEFLSLEQAL